MFHTSLGTPAASAILRQARRKGSARYGRPVVSHTTIGPMRSSAGIVASTFRTSGQSVRFHAELALVLVVFFRKIMSGERSDQSTPPDQREPCEAMPPS